MAVSDTKQATELHAWYSQTMSERGGDAIYELTSTGKPTAVSWVTRSREPPAHAPSDIVYVGLVGRFIASCNRLTQNHVWLRC